MRRFPRTLGIALVALLLALPVAPALASEYVLDGADIIDAACESRIEALSLRVEKATPGAEIAVATVHSLEGREIEEYAEELFEQLGVGSDDLDNGVLLLVAPNERRVRIEVGYGLEGALPDSRAGRIIDSIILPAFQAGDMTSGIEAGHAEIAAIVVAEYEGFIPGLEEPTTSATSGLMFLLWIGLGAAAAIWLLTWAGKKGWLKNTGGGGGSSWTPPPSSFGGSSSSGSDWSSSDSGSSSPGGGFRGGGFGGGNSGGGGASGSW